MPGHMIVQIYPTVAPLTRQNALSPSQWKKVMMMIPEPATHPCPAEAFLPQEWDIEKGRF
jgi:hypothetical protein